MGGRGGSSGLSSVTPTIKQLDIQKMNCKEYLMTQVNYKDLLRK